MSANSIQSDRVRKPNDISIQSIRLISYTGAEVDLSNIFQELNIFENIFENFLSGNITIADGLNLIRHLPIIGREYLEVSWSTPGTDVITKRFAVYRVSPRHVAKDTVQVYTLNFCSPEQLRNREVKISKSFKGFHDEIVTQLFDYIKLDDNKVFEVMPTSDTDTILVPFWSPMQTINHIAKRSRPKVGPNDQSYLFFENLDGFYFLPANQLFGRDINWSYTYGRAMDSRQADDGFDTMHALAQSYSQIKEYSSEDTFNRLKEIRSGKFAATQFTYDVTNKTFDQTVYSYAEDFKRTSHSSEFPVLPSLKDSLSGARMSSLQYRPMQPDRYSDRVTSKETNWGLNHNAVMQQLTSFVINLTVSGDSRRRVGEMVFLNIPTPEANDGGTVLPDPYLSGNFLITSIRHRISKNDYECYMKVAKDSLEQPFPDFKTNTIQNNRQL